MYLSLYSQLLVYLLCKGACLFSHIFALMCVYMKSLMCVNVCAFMCTPERAYAFFVDVYVSE